ncbi:hypothetical protein NBT05_00795 [Aquimarina sp. ERC-38]|uniref:hypothetical protein n=1 Tax=Aquimarina sp. ERC-38 TaxID=2949996 RepID=UPI00224530CF|nr:hypothetical protein [Aquimarina sp. ERC-38]UZO81030.1 hypothetical protein NBT05_00795 [Aquimarina sp. ERC-38]
MRLSFKIDPRPYEPRPKTKTSCLLVFLFPVSFFKLINRQLKELKPGTHLPLPLLKQSTIKANGPVEDKSKEKKKASDRTSRLSA